jgi:hypothetical protein
MNFSGTVMLDGVPPLPPRDSPLSDPALLPNINLCAAFEP